MCCFLCFIEEELQKKKRLWAQDSKDRYEDTLDIYGKQFVDVYKNLQPIKKCKIHKTENPNVIEYFTNVQQSLPNDHEVSDFFEEIKKIYSNWISNNQSKAYESMKKIMEGIPIDDFAEKKLNLKLFFRCRKGNVNYTKEDLYHIPFNKRYLIGNQRYSVSGIPILYLGNSVVDTAVETRVDFSEFEKYQFSSFLLKPNEKLNLFKFINLFPFYIEIIKSIGQVGHLSFGNAKPYAKDWKNIFKIFILNSCCSFRRRNDSEGNVFSEEYVLPQLITQVLCSLKYDGIIFESTRMDEVDIYTERYKINYKLNIALFTHYSRNDIFDRSLIEKFIISAPLRITDSKDISETDIDNQKNKCMCKSVIFGHELTDIASYSVSSSLEFDDLKMKDKETKKWTRYYKTPIGKFQKYLEYCAYNSFLYDI